MTAFLRRLRRKVFKRWARNAFFPGWRVRLLRWCGIAIGRDVYIADDLLIVEELGTPEAITIGDRASFAPRVTLVTSSHPNASHIRAFAPVQRGPIVIEADAWIGAGATILPGVTVRRGAVIAAHAVVAEDVAPFHVVGGIPARTIRVLEPPAGWS